MSKEEEKEKFIKELYILYTSKKVKNFLEFSYGEKRVLVFLSESKESVSPSDIVCKLAITKQRVTSILNSLKKKKYITMKMDEIDRRRIIIKLTSEGKKYIDEESKDIVDEISKTLSGFSENELEEMTKLINKINCIINSKD